jgi:hypothetical protein
MSAVIDGPFSGIGIDMFVDETLPPDCVKFLHGTDQASVFGLHLREESATLVATWPEKLEVEGNAEAKPVLKVEAEVEEIGSGDGD